MNTRHLRVFTCASVFILLSAGVRGVIGGRWYMYRLLRSPGLVNNTAGSHDECVSKCRSTSGCSAVSWQSCSGTCLLSMCNSLDLYRNNGWNTYVLVDSYVETMAFPASHMEWMLTDTCGNNNLGAGLGPAMNLYSTTYNPSPSVYAGNAVTFAGNTASYAKTNADTNVNNPLSSTSLTTMFWVYFNTATTLASLLEFTVGNTTRGIIHWIASGGLYSDLTSSLGTNCGSASKCYDKFAWAPAANTWYHIAFVYNGDTGIESSYINSSAVNIVSIGIIQNTLQWNTVYLGITPFDTAGALNGRGFCYKVYKAALTGEQIAAASKSCFTSKIRFSG